MSPAHACPDRCFRFRTVSGILASLCLAQGAHASGPPALPLWEVGVLGIGVSQLAYPGADTQVNRGLGLPYLIYRGEFLRADRDTAGFRALKTEQFEVDIGVAGAFAARGSAAEARQGMKPLGTLVEFGPRLKWNLGSGPGGGRWRVDLPVRGVFDLSDQAAHRGMAFEPQLSFQRRAQGGWFYSTSLSAVLADRRLAGTFYTVGPADVRADRPAYAAEAGLVSWRLGASFARSLSPDLRVFGFARLDHVGAGANADSPLVRRDLGMSAGVGLTYTLARSTSRAAD